MVHPEFPDFCIFSEWNTTDFLKSVGDLETYWLGDLNKPPNVYMAVLTHEAVTIWNVQNQLLLTTVFWQGQKFKFLSSFRADCVYFFGITWILYCLYLSKSDSPSIT